jgi:hypothetical protein
MFKQKEKGETEFQFIIPGDISDSEIKQENGKNIKFNYQNIR